jgi:hypothetical protein
MSDRRQHQRACGTPHSSGILRVRAALKRCVLTMNPTARFYFFYFYGFPRLAERVERRA